ncbi:MAG: UDP-N-acetylmuramoyl-L-alanyl-D-glutamate--2,6-diaminopimelate ligase [Solitalea-like symbiont of Acarus siro]
MNISKEDILKSISYIKTVNDTAVDVLVSITNIYTDSREVAANSIFIALKGDLYDAHQFIDQAILKGAVIIICTELPIKLHKDILYISVSDSKRALNNLITAFYSQEIEKIKIIGITGTNGKTTTSTLLYQLFSQLGYKVGLISTIDIKINNESYPTKNTTPDILSLNKFLYKMVQQGCKYSFMEVSSHALIQERVKNIDFYIAALTNITHDHLDYHKTFNNYIKAKKILFDNLTAKSIALVNKDDKHSTVMLQNTKADKKTYAIKNMADFKASITEKSLSGMQLCIDNQDIWVKLTGMHNAYNILLVYAIATLIGIDKHRLLTHISKLDPIKGRFEMNYLANGVITVIDYAHTPDGVKNILESINNTKQKDQQIITVIGAGGDRDAEKRPIMANEAYQLSNYLVLTSDNPRNEDPQKIINDMKKTFSANNNKNFEEIIDRKQAIIRALSIAKEGDIVVILGKGHEQYIDIKGQRIKFSEQDIIKEFNNTINT